MMDPMTKAIHISETQADPTGYAWRFWQLTRSRFWLEVYRPIREHEADMAEEEGR